MTEQHLWTLIQDVSQALVPHYQAAGQAALEETGMQGADWFVSFLSAGLDPEPLTIARFHALLLYTSVEDQKQLLEAAVERGCLQTAEPGTYRLTERGRKGLDRFYAETGKALAAIEPLPASEMDRLADLLDRIVSATVNAKEPVDKTQFFASRRTDPGRDAPALVRIDQYLTDLYRYRDDAHLAAWLPHHVSGQAWEAFTLIWRGEAGTPGELAEKLKNRGYSEEVYANALQELVRRGWLAENGAYQITEAGRKIRDAAEAATDRYFFTGRSALSEAEADELTGSLTRLRDALQDLVVGARDDLYPLAQKVSNSIYTLTRSVMEPAVEAAGLAQRGLLSALLLAKTYDPEPISGETFRRRTPYAAPTSWDGALTTLTEKGLLAVQTGTYRLTATGKDILSELVQTFYARLGEIQREITEIDVTRLADLSGRITTAALNAPEPPGAWFVRHSHNLSPGDDAPALARIDQALDDLNAFRDDVHIASFKPYDISGHAWELFTRLWRGEVHNPAEMAEQAAGRGHPVEAYEAAISDLQQRGWVEPAEGGAYQVTEAGRQARQQSEVLTDRYFYTPWAVLDTPATEELRDLLRRLEISLQQMAEAVPA